MTREDFLTFSRSTSGPEYRERVIGELDELYSSSPERRMPVIWVEVGGCGGNTISLLNAVGPDLQQVMTGLIQPAVKN